MHDFYTSLLDHGAMWKLRNGSVICTAMPYGNEKSICDSFRALIDKFDYPMSIRFRFLEDKYRYRPNGDHMIVIYCDSSQDEFDPTCSVDILVREYRCSGGTDTANPAAGNRCSGTEIPHLIDCYLRVHSLKAGSNPYTSRIDR